MSGHDDVIHQLERDLERMRTLAAAASWHSPVGGELLELASTALGRIDAARAAAATPTLRLVPAPDAGLLAA
jgi:hypothetical protein